MKMKINQKIANYSKCLAATGSLLVAGSAKADMVTLNQGSYSYSNGGEFNAVFSSNPSQSVQVFCDEIDTVFYPGTAYSYQYVQTDSDSRTLNQGAAYLYSQFHAGTLPGYNFGNTSPGSRVADAGLLQAALWTLTGQSVGSGETSAFTNPSADPSSPAYNSFYAMALSLPTWSQPNENGSGSLVYPAEILQLYSGSTPAQAQFAPVPAPEVPMTHAMVFGGIALAGYGLFRRKSAAAVKA